MNIRIHAREAVAAHVRAYVEYRMFSAISRFGDSCARLDVRLAATEVGTQCCAVVLDMKPTGRVRIRSIADHLYAAVDQSADRLARGVARRLQAASSETDSTERR